MVNWAQKHVAAILDARYTGTEGGKQCGRFLAGDAMPGGKLSGLAGRVVLARSLVLLAQSYAGLTNDPIPILGMGRCTAVSFG